MRCVLQGGSFELAERAREVIAGVGGKGERPAAKTVAAMALKLLELGRVLIVLSHQRPVRESADGIDQRGVGVVSMLSRYVVDAER